ncbi:MAG: hypothetical protein ACK5X3_02845 [Pseudomonadota bacterium]
MADTLVYTIAEQGVRLDSQGHGRHFVHTARSWPLLYLADSGAIYLLDTARRVAYRRKVALFRLAGQPVVKWEQELPPVQLLVYACRQRRGTFVHEMGGGPVQYTVAYSPALRYPVANPLEDARYETDLAGAIPLLKEWKYLRQDLVLRQQAIQIDALPVQLALPMGYELRPFEPDMQPE